MLQQRAASIFHIERVEAIAALIALVGMGASMRLTLGQFIHTVPDINGHVITGAACLAVGLAAAAWWSRLSKGKDSAGYDFLNVLIGTLAFIGMITYSWFALAGVG